MNEKRDPESECRFVPEVSCGIFANDDDAKKMEFKCEVKEAKYEMVGDVSLSRFITSFYHNCCLKYKLKEFPFCLYLQDERKREDSI